MNVRTARRLAVLTFALAAVLPASRPEVRADPAQPAGRHMALTFDDLPYVRIGDVAYMPAASRATSSLMKTLGAYAAPAIGFVNEAQLAPAGERDARISLLRQWIDHGMILGNHTYSHPDFNSVTIEQFQNEILKGEIETRRLARPGAPLFFRHPMTHTGNTKEKKEAIERFLAARGYLIAPHTIENSDFIFNAVYVRARTSKDVALAGRLRDAYLDYTIAATGFAETVSPKIFGREIAQTLLLHANDINADNLDALLKRLQTRGYRFITLEEAMADPAYRTKDTLVSDYGPTWLWRWTKSLGLNVSFAADPDVPSWVMELYTHRE
jgi:peptidoglycan/xylan/chitin deacetylase (PgdA/CDA1 family)